MTATAGEFVMVTTTVGDEKAARELAAAVVDARLAACVQCLPIHSTYRWKGARESASEFLLLAKTRAALSERLTTFIREAHSYELPEIVVVPIVGGLAPYLEWIRTETDIDVSGGLGTL